MTAHAVLAHFDQVKIWDHLLHSKSDDVQLRAMQYLWDRILGKTPEHLITDSLPSSIKIEFCAPRAEPCIDGIKLIEAQEPEPKDRWGFPESEPEPAPPLALPEPTGKIVGLRCARHGEYVLPVNAKSDMCPTCIKEAEAAERYLFSLMPNGPN
jgi:hypothetical protein